MKKRVIRKNSVYCSTLASDLLQSLFVAEFVSPSEKIWLVSAWISDIPILDNTGLGFSGVSPRWGPGKIRLTEVLVELATRGTTVIVATNQDTHNDGFKQRLSMKADEAGVSEIVHIIEERELHTKALLGDNYYLDGSMNFTNNGLEVNDETLSLVLEPDDVVRARMEYEAIYKPIVRAK